MWPTGGSVGDTLAVHVRSAATWSCGAWHCGRRLLPRRWVSSVSVAANLGLEVAAPSHRTSLLFANVVGGGFFKLSRPAGVFGRTLFGLHGYTAMAPIRPDDSRTYVAIGQCAPDTSS